MSASLKIVIAASTLAAISTLGAGTATAATRTGTLVCRVAPGMGFIVGSIKRLDCTYNSRRGAEHYSGKINRIGLDVGMTTGGQIVWAVLEPTKRHGDLAGTYAGATAEATAGVGLGANVLVGGGNGISLQPLSISGQKGLNLAAGIGSVTLSRTQ